MTLPVHEEEESAPTAAPPEEEAPHAGLLEAVRAFIVQIGRDVRENLVRSLATYASLALLWLVVIAAGTAMAATGAVLLVQGTDAAVAAWLGSVAAGHCLAGLIFLAIPLAGAWLALRSWRR